jgi:hypothetical protein
LRVIWESQASQPYGGLVLVTRCSTDSLRRPEKFRFSQLIFGPIAAAKCAFSRLLRLSIRLDMSALRPVPKNT